MRPRSARPDDGRTMGSQFRIRQIRPDDAHELQAFYARLSPESRRLRFLGTTSGISDDQATGFASAASRSAAGFVADDDGRIVGHGVVEPTRPGAVEMAFAVDDAWQRRGIGRSLLAASVAWARAHGDRRIELELFADNLAMRRLLRGVPEASALVHPDGSVDQVELVLPAAA
jgi:GNAT superfamily N-acetyltransferase